MNDLQRRAVLLEHGFSIDACNELTVVGFPDRHDGLVLDFDESETDGAISARRS